MNNLLISISAASAALTFIMAGAPGWIKHKLNRKVYSRLKPFDCEFCLGFWSGIVSGIYFEKPAIEIIYIGCMSAIIAQSICLILNRLKY